MTASKWTIDTRVIAAHLVAGIILVALILWLQVDLTGARGVTVGVFLALGSSALGVRAWNIMVVRALLFVFVVVGLWVQGWVSTVRLDLGVGAFDLFYFLLSSAVPVALWLLIGWAFTGLLNARRSSR